MVGKIIQDQKRFKDIINRDIRKKLHKYISRDEFILPDKSGKGKISIPIPHINIPHFKYETRQLKGIGQGDGDIGDSVGGDVGNMPGEHALEEIELSEEEFFEILGEALELPYIEPKGRNVQEKKYSYRGIRKVGPESLKQFKRTYKEALKRQIASGDYDYKNPVIVPVKNDKRYRALKSETSSEVSAVIFHIIDVSGSMGDEQREIVRRITFCVDGWISRFYKNMEQRYITHDVEAREVDRNTFFRTKEGGGTLISSGLELLADIVAQEYPVDEWNIYAFYFTDGDNWNTEDNKKCMRLLGDRIMLKMNLFCFGHILSGYSNTENFFNFLKKEFEKNERIRIANLESRDDIVKAIKQFLGKER